MNFRCIFATGLLWFSTTDGIIFQFYRVNGLKCYYILKLIVNGLKFILIVLFVTDVNDLQIGWSQVRKWKN